MTLRAEVGDRVGDERAREHRLDLAVLAVREHHRGTLRARSPRARGRRRAPGARRAWRPRSGRRRLDACARCRGRGVDDVGRAVDRGGRGGELVGHGRQPTDGPARRVPCRASGAGGGDVAASSAVGVVVGARSSASWLPAARWSAAVVAGGVVVGGDVVAALAVVARRRAGACAGRRCRARPGCCPRSGSSAWSRRRPPAR